MVKNKLCIISLLLSDGDGLQGSAPILLCYFDAPAQHTDGRTEDPSLSFLTWLESLNLHSIAIAAQVIQIDWQRALVTKQIQIEQRLNSVWQQENETTDHTRAEQMEKEAISFWLLHFKLLIKSWIFVGVCLSLNSAVHTASMRWQAMHATFIVQSFLYN